MNSLNKIKKTSVMVLFFVLFFDIPVFADGYKYTYSGPGLKFSRVIEDEHLEYDYYIPKNITSGSSVPAIILVSENWKNIIDQSWKDFADKKNRIIIASSFVFKRSHNGLFQDQYPEHVSSGAIKAVLKQFSKAGYRISDLYMMGFPGLGADVVFRHALMHPKEVRRCAIMGSDFNYQYYQRAQSVPVKFFFGILKNAKSNQPSSAEKVRSVSIRKREYRNAGRGLTQEMQNDVRSFFN